MRPLANANAGGHPGRTVRQHLRLPILQVRLSLRDRAAARRRLSDQPQDRVSRRMGSELPVRCATPPAALSAPTESTIVAANSPSYIPAANQFVNIETPGAIAAADLARHQSESSIRISAPRRPGAYSARRATKTGRRASTNSASASSGRSPGISSWKRPTWATAPFGLAAAPGRS